jgi:hypothetical protein
MRHALLTLTVILLSPAAFAGDCMSRCQSSSTSCASRCGDNPRCFRQCDNQLKACTTSCQARGDISAPGGGMVKGKCPGPNGKMVPCAEMAKSIDPNKLSNAVAPRPIDDKYKNKKPSAEEMQKMREFGLAR